MQPVPDPYALLGLDRAADAREVKRTYRRLAKRYHPDASRGDVRDFVALQTAYDTLSDPERRREWDRRHPTSGRRSHAGARGANGSPGARMRGRGAGGNGDARPADPWRDRPRDAQGRFVRLDPSVPWWEELRTPDAARLEVPGSRSETGLGPSSSGAAWSSASRAYFRRLTRPESAARSRRRSPGPKPATE